MIHSIVSSAFMPVAVLAHRVRPSPAEEILHRNTAGAVQRSFWKRQRLSVGHQNNSFGHLTWLIEQLSLRTGRVPAAYPPNGLPDPSSGHTLCTLMLPVGKAPGSRNTLAVGVNHDRASQPRGLLQLQPHLAPGRPHNSPPPCAFAMRAACIAHPGRTVPAAMLHYHNACIAVASPSRATYRAATMRL